MVLESKKKENKELSSGIGVKCKAECMALCLSNECNQTYNLLYST